MIRIKRLAHISAGQSPSSDDVRPLAGGLPFLQGNAEFGTRTPRARFECDVPAKICAPGDLLLSIRAPVGALNAADQAYGIGRGLCAVRPLRVDGRFLWWCLEGSRPALESVATGSTFSAVSTGDVGNLEILDVLPDEQRAIADFLDEQTSRIDTLIAKQIQLIDTLRERRLATIESAIPSGPNAPLRSRARLIQTGPFGSQISANAYIEGGVPVLNPSHFGAEGVTPDPKVSVGPEMAQELARHRLKIDDLILARRGELGRCAVIDEAAAGSICGTGSLLVRLDPHLADARFISLVVGSRATRRFLDAASVGSTMSNLNASIVAGIRVPDISRLEQQAIVSALDDQTSRIHDLIAKAEEFVGLARERRASLITAAVTGQIDVRTAGRAASVGA